jgi:hypothetical protein
MHSRFVIIDRLQRTLMSRGLVTGIFFVGRAARNSLYSLERDRHFSANKTISAYTDEAREHGCIVA